MIISTFFVPQHFMRIFYSLCTETNSLLECLARRDAKTGKEEKRLKKKKAREEERTKWKGKVQMCKEITDIKIA